MGESYGIPFMLDAIKAALRLIGRISPSPETDRIADEAYTLREAVESWRRQLPLPHEREAIMHRVLQLHADAARCARSGSTPAPGDRVTPPVPPPAVPQERETVPPPFDLQAFARSSMSPDDSPPPSVEERTAEMLDRYATGDQEGALELADLILAATPGSAIAIVCREGCANALEATYAKAVGPFDRIPVLRHGGGTAPPSGLDHRAGFLMSLIDGATNIEAILDVCAMPRWLALRVLADLIRDGLVRLR